MSDSRTNTARLRHGPVTTRPAAPVVLALLAIVAALVVPVAAAAQSPGLAFTTFRGDTARVYAVNADGSGVRALTQTRDAAFEGSPAYSPDGRRIVYTCGNFELCIMNADGTAPARLTTNDWPGTLQYDTSPAWSPDGTLIAFVHTVGGLDGISVVRPDGSGRRELPVSAGINGSPSFSPDSKSIAFDHAEDETGDSELPSRSSSAIAVIGADGSGLRTLVKRVDADKPAWSPDGAHIAFTRSFDEANSQIVVMDAGGGALRRLTSRSVQASSAAWSPDSSTIAFSGAVGDRAAVYRIAATGGRAVRLTSGRGFDVEPTWQPSAPATPAPPFAALAAPPSVATPDARFVGVLLRALLGIVLVLDRFDRARAADLLVAATSMDRLARQIRAAARPLRPANPSVQTARRRVLQSLSFLREYAVATRRWARSVRRHDRRDARRRGEKVRFGVIFTVVVQLAAATGEVGFPQSA
jgi:Tol biopolymer transport system component